MKTERPTNKLSREWIAKLVGGRSALAAEACALIRVQYGHRWLQVLQARWRLSDEEVQAIERNYGPRRRKRKKPPAEPVTEAAD